VSIVNKPHSPLGSEQPRDDDPTGVHALLSSLPHPDPMPEHLVERINASLAAEQAQRAAGMSSGPATPMVAVRAHRRSRLVFAVAGAAAAVVVVAVVSSITLSGSQTTETSVSAAIASASSSTDNSMEAAPGADAKAPTVAGGQPSSAAQSNAAAKRGFSSSEKLVAAGVAVRGSVLQIRLSGTHYTEADFPAQARTLRSAARAQFLSAPSIGPASTTDWVRECMRAIGAREIQVIEADFALYEDRPAVVVVGVANGTPLAYVVAPECSHAYPAVLRPATPLP
jgi:hypothetical protein